MDLFECEFMQRTVQLRGRGKRPKPSVFSEAVGAADVLQISFGAFILVSFDVFFFFFLVSLCDSPYRNETDEPSSSK